MIERRDEQPPLLWIRERSSEIEIASCVAPEGSALRVVDSEGALEAIEAIRGNALLAMGIVVVESSSNHFNAICKALGSLDPSPRVIFLYPRLRLLGSVFAPPDFSSMRHGAGPVH